MKWVTIVIISFISFRSEFSFLISFLIPSTLYLFWLLVSQDCWAANSNFCLSSLLIVSARALFSSPKRLASSLSAYTSC